MKVLVVVVLSLLAINAANAADPLKCHQCEACHDSENLPTAAVCKEDTVLPPRWEVEQTTEAPATTTLAPDEPQRQQGKQPLTNKFKREVKAETEFQCFKQLVKSGDNRVIRRGCTKATQEVCKAAAGESCDLCNTEACNFANNVPSWTFGSLLLLAIVKMFF